MKDMDYRHLRYRKQKLERELKYIEDNAAGRNESFRKRVTEDGRLVNRKIDVFIADILVSYRVYRKYERIETLNSSQEELYSTFLYCAITAYSALSDLGEYGAVYIPVRYSDLNRMAVSLQKQPLKERKDITLLLEPQFDGESFTEGATGGFWALMEDVFRQFDPSQIKKRKKKDEHTIYPARQPDDDLLLQDDPIYEYYLNFLQPQIEEWKEQLPDGFLFCERYRRFKDLYFDDKCCDKSCIAKDIAEMVDIYLFDRGISVFCLEDSFELMLERIERASSAMERTDKRARISK